MVTILNTSDPLGKFDGKSDEGYIVGYSTYGRVYNLASHRIEETMNLNFLKNKPNIQGTGAKAVRTQATSSTYAGSQDHDDSDSDDEQDNHAEKDALTELQRQAQAGMNLSKTFSVSAERSPPTSPVSAEAFNFAGRTINSAGRKSNSAGRSQDDLGGPSLRFPTPSELESSDLHDGSKIYNYPDSGIFTSSSYDDEYTGPDVTNMKSTIDVNPTATTRMEPASVYQALNDPDWVEAIQEEMQQFKNQQLLRASGMLHFLSVLSKKWISTGNHYQPLSEERMPKTSSLFKSLMYLTSSQTSGFAVMACARNQVSPTTSNLLAVKRIFKYLKAFPKLGHLVSFRILSPIPFEASRIVIMLELQGGIGNLLPVEMSIFRRRAISCNVKSKLSWLHLLVKLSMSQLLHVVVSSGGSKLVAVKTLLGLSLVADLIHCYMFTFLLADHEKDQQLCFDDLDQLNKQDLEEYDLKHQMAMHSIRVRKFEKKAGRKIKFNGRESARAPPLKQIPTYKLGRKESQPDKRLDDVSAEECVPAEVVISADDVVDSAEAVDSADCVVFTPDLDDIGAKPIYNRFDKVDHMKAVPPPMTGNYKPTSNASDDNEIVREYGKQTSETTEIKTPTGSLANSNDSAFFDFSDRSSEPSPKDFSSFDSSMECSEPSTSDNDSQDSTSVKSTGSASEETRVTGSILGPYVSNASVPSVSFSCNSKTKCDNVGSLNKRSLFSNHKSSTSKSCFVCGSTKHLIKDCDYYEKRLDKGRGSRNNDSKRKTPTDVSADRSNPISADTPISAEFPNSADTGKPICADSYNSAEASIPAGYVIPARRARNGRPTTPYVQPFSHPQRPLHRLPSHNGHFYAYLNYLNSFYGESVYSPSAYWTWTDPGFATHMRSHSNRKSSSNYWLTPKRGDRRIDYPPRVCAELCRHPRHGRQREVVREQKLWLVKGLAAWPIPLLLTSRTMSNNITQLLQSKILIHYDFKTQQGAESRVGSALRDTRKVLLRHPPGADDYLYTDILRKTWTKSSLQSFRGG
ncbi:hypothetical protein Tco_0531342 [Tanacetum coccineum]